MHYRLIHVMWVRTDNTTHETHLSWSYIALVHFVMWFVRHCMLNSHPSIAKYINLSSPAALYPHPMYAGQTHIIIMNIRTTSSSRSVYSNLFEWISSKSFVTWKFISFSLHSLSDIHIKITRKPLTSIWIACFS